MKHTLSIHAIVAVARSPRGHRTTWRRFVLGLALLAMPGCCIGESLRATCAPYEAMKRRNMTKWVATRDAKRLWRDCYAAKYRAEPCVEDVREGFVLAYVETALGGNGCPPPVPVSPLLSHRTLTHSYPNGNQWFFGYQLGYTTALSNGVDRERFAPLNPELMCLPPNVAAVAYSGTETDPCFDTVPLGMEYETSEYIIEPAPIHDESGDDSRSTKPTSDSMVPLPIESTQLSPRLDGELVPGSLSEARIEIRPVVIDNPASQN